MILKWFKKTPPAVENESTRLYGLAMGQAKLMYPSRFEHPTENIPERIAKFEALSIYMSAIFWQLSKSSKNKQLAQALHDKMFSYVDAALREQGVGDMKVGKEVKKLVSAFYGRLQAYETAFEANDVNFMKQAMERNYVFQESDDADALAADALAFAYKDMLSATAA